MVAAMLATLATAEMADNFVTGWRGEALCDWTGHTLYCKDVEVKGGVLHGTVIGRDPQLYATLAQPLKPAADHVVYIRLKAATSGKAQLFWIREGDGGASEERQRSFYLKGDGQWHNYRVKPRWTGAAINALRLDLPMTFSDGKRFELAAVAIRKEGDQIDANADEVEGVAFTLKMPPGLHYCSVTWCGESSGAFTFTPATDGREHSYWLKLRGEKDWRGKVNCIGVEQAKIARNLPASDVRLLAAAPTTAADPVITSALSGEAVPRAGRPFTVEAVVRNYGTSAAEDLEFAFEGLPKGVRVLERDALRPAEPLPGTDGRESNGLGKGSKPGLVCQKVYRFTLSDLGAGEKRFYLTMKAKGVAPQRIEVKANVLPSLGLAPLDYPAEPQPVDTAPYEIGALLFPGWTVHRWHAVWTHAPWRKPVLGWYDESKPETVDWQIKHMVENGISFVSVDWYWNRGRLGMNQWMRTFKQAKYRKYLKWSLMWANHTGPGTHSIEDQRKVTKFWIDNYFCDPQYQRVDGKPVVGIFVPSLMESDMKGQGGCKALLELSRQIAREAGYPGIWFVAFRGPDIEDAKFLATFRDFGFDSTTVYRYFGNGVDDAPYEVDGSLPFKWIADSSLRHWQRLKKNGSLPFWPSLSTGWDNRPWLGDADGGWAVTATNTNDFRRICQAARAFADQTGVKTFLMGPLDEWGEGEIGYPNMELGFGMLEAVRDTFGKRPAGGWPLNYAPEDVGRVCPQWKEN